MKELFTPKQHCPLMRVHIKRRQVSAVPTFLILLFVVLSLATHCTAAPPATQMKAPVSIVKNAIDTVGI